jgi:hypothetical protein
MPTPASRRRLILGEVRAALVILAAGLLLGAVWALFAPGLARAADLGESRVAVDGLLALLGLGAGIVTAIVLALVPGPNRPLRVAVVLAAAVIANLLAAAVGVTLGGLKLGAPGVALLWPLTAAVLTTLRTLAGFVISPDDEHPRPPRHAGADGTGRGSHPDDGFSGPPEP